MQNSNRPYKFDEELGRKLLVRKIQKTAANFKAAENTLPSPIVSDYNLLPNSVSTKTFKERHNLHSVLCKAALTTKSSDFLIGEKNRSRIPIYRDLNSQNNSPSTNNSPIMQRTPLTDCNQISVGHHPVLKLNLDALNDGKEIGENEEHFESALEESFETEERKIVEQNSSSRTLTDETREIKSSIAKDVQQLRQSLSSTSQKMDEVLDQFDKTFEEQRIDAPNKYVHTEMTTSSTQTPNWNKGREKRSAVGNQMRMIEPKFLSGKLRQEIKDVLNLRKETLREYYRIRLHLLHEKENNAPIKEKASFAAKYQRILDEFDAKKIKMKRDFETKDPNKLLKQYHFKIMEEQEAVDQLSTTLNQIRNGTTATELNLLLDENGDGHDDDSTMDDEGVGQNPIEESNKDSHRSENTSSEQRTSAEIESIPEELPDESQKKILRKQQAEDGAHDDSTMETSMDDVDSSFKTYEKSLGSILTSVRSNITTGRESACRRRSSAGEALIKLRMMHGGIPPLSAFKDPTMESKSPPNTPKSPLTNDRFVAKFPQHGVTSREASYSEEFSPIAAASISDEQMLDELPNTSEIAMLLDISQSPTSSKEHFNFPIKIARRISAHQVLDKLAGQKKLIEKCGQLLWKKYLDQGDEYDGSYPNSQDEADQIANEDEADEIMSISMIRQLCCECLLTLIQTAHSNATSRHALSSEQEMIAYFKKEVLLPVIEPQKATICSEGVRARAEKTSHFQLNANRLLASKYLYEELSVWPNQNLLKSIDQAVIEKLSFI